MKVSFIRLDMRAINVMILSVLMVMLFGVGHGAYAELDDTCPTDDECICFGTTKAICNSDVNLWKDCTDSFWGVGCDTICASLVCTADPPTVTTTAVTTFETTTATLAGEITDTGGENATVRGVCWNTAVNPTTANSKEEATGDFGTGTFSFDVTTGLAAGIKYYVRAYATNSANTTYGNEVFFTTTASATAPTVTTTAVSTFHDTTATLGGNITATGGENATKRGVCWSTSTGPTTADSISEDTGGSYGTGDFSFNVTSLTAGETYYVKAYAENAVDISYGDEVSFTTLDVPTVTTETPGDAFIKQTEVTVFGNVTNDGVPITARGFCYGASVDPTDTTGNCTTNGSGTGSFNSGTTIAGLTAATTYHVRAYADNSVGRGYGEDRTFTTDPPPGAPTVTTASITSITETGASGGGNVTSDGGDSVTAKGVCWGESTDPSTSGTCTTDGTGTGTFTSSITGLAAETTYYVKAYATNSAGTAYGLQVSFETSATGTAPTAENGTLSTDEDTDGTSTLVATDNDGDALTYSIADNGSKGTAVITNATTGAYTYTPDANENGEDTFTFKANDGTADSNTATITVTITPKNDVPVAADGVLTTNEDTAGSSTLVATDVDDGDTLTYSVVANGSKGTAAITNAATGAYTYTPDANKNGEDTFTFRANDGTANSNTATITVTITPVNDEPVAADGTLTADEGVEKISALNATDADEDTLTYTIVDVATKGTATITNPATGAYTYTSNAGESGEDTFTFKANDGTADSDPATITVTIAGGDMPVATDDTLTTNEDTDGSGTLSATDGGGGALTFSIVTNGSKGTAAITDTATGAYTYTPDANENGEDTFTFRANNGTADSNTATITVTITPKNDVPVAADGVLTTNEDTAGSSTLVATDVDDGDTLTYSVVANGSKGTVAITDTATGAYTYTPTQGESGTDTFTFKVNDGTEDSDTGTITVTINSLGKPMAENGALNAKEDTEANGTLSATDADEDPLTYSIVVNGTKGTAEITDTATGDYTYTPNQGETGTDTFTFKANDGTADSNIATITVTISVNGDIDCDGDRDLADLILALKISAGIATTDETVCNADVNNDGKIGVEELIYILQEVLTTDT